MRGLSLLMAACGVAAAALLWRMLIEDIAPPPGASSIAVRLGIALVWLLPLAGLLFAMLLVQMAARFVTGASDAAAGLDGAFLHQNQAAIGSTLEQSAVFAAALLALVAQLDGPRMPGALALAPVFAAARVAFWAGSLVAPAGRALGQAASMTAAAAALAWAVASWAGSASIG